MANVELYDYSVKVKGAINDKAIAFLYEVGGELEARTKMNTRVGDTGQTKNAWSYRVDEDDLSVTVGNTLENAIWEEFGTGEYALNNDGRKGGWIYKDENKNEFHFTMGKKPNKALRTAYNSLKSAIVKRAQEIMGELK